MRERARERDFACVCVQARNEETACERDIIRSTGWVWEREGLGRELSHDEGNDKITEECLGRKIG